VSILASSLTLGAADYEWRDGAICRATDPELFFPVGATGQALVQIDRAKEVCGECKRFGSVLRRRHRRTSMSEHEHDAILAHPARRCASEGRTARFGR
jgi:hypothetical protein